MRQTIRPFRCVGKADGPCQGDLRGASRHMSIQFRLTVMNFMQFFVWGSWLIPAPR